MRRSALVLVALVAPLALAACKGQEEEPGPDGSASPLGKSSTQAFTSYMGKSKAAEAKINLDRLLRSMSSFVAEERVAPGGTELLVGGCPGDGRPEGETGITPPLDVACSKGPGGKCMPGGGGDGGYDAKLWREGSVWAQLGFELMDPHFFHYNFKWKNDPAGSGSCQFTAQAFGDLDDDGVYSTYERSGTAIGGEVTRDAELRVENELE